MQIKIIISVSRTKSYIKILIQNNKLISDKNAGRNGIYFA